MQNLLRDIQTSLRSLRGRPGLTAAIVLSIALAVGANTAIFSFVNSLFFRTLPGIDGEGLVSIYGTDSSGRSPMPFLPISYPNIADLRAGNEVFSDVAAYAWLFVSLTTDDGSTHRLFGQLVNGSFFDVLGVKPFLGQTFEAGFDAPLGGHPVVVISHGLWQQRFASDPNVIGKHITLSRQPFTVIGVAPPGFRGPETLNDYQVWIPFSMYEQIFPGPEAVRERRWRIFNTVARLRPGVTLEQASSAVATISSRLQSDHADVNKDRGLTVLSFHGSAVDPNRRAGFERASVLIMAIVGLVLLVAVANVGNLMLSKAAGKRKEFALRTSLGASRGQITRLLLTESLLVSLAGGLVGLGVGYACSKFLAQFRPPFFVASAVEAGMDGRVLAFTLGISLLAGILFGLAPVFAASDTRLTDSLKNADRLSAPGSRRLTLRNLFTVAQVALCLVAMLTSGLFLVSLRAAERFHPGFEVDRLLVFAVDVAAEGFSEERGRAYYQRLETELKAVPGVTGADLATNLPLAPIPFFRTASAEQAGGDNSGSVIALNMITNGFFETAGIPLTKGRAFNLDDRAGTDRVGIVNEALAANLWPGQDPLGRSLWFRDDPNGLLIVGVAKDAKYVSLSEPPQPLLYLPLSQNFTPFLSVQVRTAGPAASQLDTVRRAVEAIDRTVPLVSSQTASELVRGSLWSVRMGAALLTTLAALTVVLAALGVYATVSYLASRRRFEIGLRMALGSDRSQVLRLILKQGVGVALFGIAVGLALAWFFQSSIKSFLFAIEPTHLGVWLLASLFLFAIAALANFLPALRASREEPARVLRS